MADRIDTLVILGAQGDLTSRLLLPGLASYLGSERAHGIRLIGADREPLSDDGWRQRVTASFGDEAAPLAREVLEGSRYQQCDVTDADALASLLAACQGRTALYFALPPSVTERACRTLSTMSLPAGLTLALEKPFGTDLRSAKALNRLLETMVPEEQVFRVDHFLGKSTVLNLLGLRFANRIFEPLLSAPNVERIDIVVDETLGLEGRAGYYDTAGALIDMIQSHLLLVLALVTMEPPASLQHNDLRGSMAQVLRATRPHRADGTSSRRARYGAGRIGDRDLPAYVDEPGVDPARGTETLAEVTLEIDNWRWAGVPIRLRSGKGLGDARQDILVTFRPVPHLPTGFSGGDEQPSVLRISMKPATLALDLVVNGEGDPFELERTHLDAELRAGDLSAYGEVLNALMDGDPSLAVRGDVAEECWRIVTPFLQAWREDAVPLESYPAGSSGPA
ncbi:MAG TPA: glucose-6-phosphate dehydrogenase [Rhodoglobus sp.]|nr:glucose-6-phosphate dehydrogenase [Rhodoglobus sp.]